MTSFPIHLNLENRFCLVIGGAPVAIWRVNQLLSSGARVLWLTRRVPASLKDAVQDGFIRCYSRPFKPSDTRGMVLVMNTFKSKPSLSKALFKLAVKDGFLLNCHDQPQYSTFIMPALLQKGGLQIGISTGGISPYLSRRLKEDLNQIFDGEFVRFLEWVASRRAEVSRSHPLAKSRLPALKRIIEDFRLSGKIHYPKQWG